MYGNASKIAVNATCGNNFNKIGLPYVYIALFRCLWVPGGGLEQFRRVLRSDGWGSQPSKRKTRLNGSKPPPGTKRHRNNAM